MPLQDESVEVRADAIPGHGGQFEGQSDQASISAWIPLLATRGARRAFPASHLDERFIRRLKTYRLRRASSTRR